MARPTAPHHAFGVSRSAGRFDSWLARFDETARGDHEPDVPCGTCSACCTSSQFVMVGPDEQAVRAHVPPRLLTRAPELPRGYDVLAFDARGHCPMLVQGRCSIYAHRPRACRTYDCRVMTAAGLPDHERPTVAARVEEWRFTLRTKKEQRALDAVRAAVRFLDAHGPALGALPRGAPQRAALALLLRGLFEGPTPPRVDEVARAVAEQRSAARARLSRRG